MEELFGKLCRLYEMEFRPSYRTSTQQIDAAFEFKGFTYVSELRWRTNPPTHGDLVTLKGKVDSKIESVRGFFLSVAGFRNEVISEFRTTGRASLILMSGLELALILEGNPSLPDALSAKIKAAEQQGQIWHDMSVR